MHLENPEMTGSFKKNPKEQGKCRVQVIEVNIEVEIAKNFF